MNRELVRLARRERRAGLTYLLLFVCTAAMVGNLLREAFHLRAKAPEVAAALAARADHLAARGTLKSLPTHFTVTPATPVPSGSRS